MAKSAKPGVIPLLDELERLLQVARQTFVDHDQFFFPGILSHRLPRVVEELQAFIGKPADRTPFWNCVKAVDHHWTSLGLIATLDKLVKRATNIPPAPLGHVLHRRSTGRLNSWQKDFVDRWEEESGGSFDNPPTDLATCWRFLEPLTSEEFRDKQKKMTAAIVDSLRHGGDKSVEEFLGFAAFLDFDRQRTRWRDRYWAGHEGLHPLICALENEDYERMRAPILESAEPFSKEARARELARERVRKARAK